jgi:hypothetical protein
VTEAHGLGAIHDLCCVVIWDFFGDEKVLRGGSAASALIGRLGTTSTSSPLSSSKTLEHH